MHTWQTHFAAEMQQAQTARRAGNEGMARVCARRAAGIVVSEYLRRLGLPPAGPSIYAQLRLLRVQPGLPPQVHRVAEHLLLRVAPGGGLPIAADLLAETSWLKDELLGE